MLNILKSNILFRPDIYLSALESVMDSLDLLDDDLNRELCFLFITVLPFLTEAQLSLNLVRIYTGN